MKINDIAKIFWVIRKNMRIVARSWSSVGVLIIGPLALMLLMGFSFAGADLHDVTIGVYSEGVDSKYILGQFSYGKIIDYNSLDSCRRALISEGIDACLHMKNEFLSTGSQKINIIVYYDNSRKISAYLVPMIESKISASSKSMVKGAVDEVAVNFKTAQDFLQSSKYRISKFSSALESAILSLRRIKSGIESKAVLIENEYYSIEALLSGYENNVKKDKMDTISSGIDSALSTLNSMKTSVNEAETAIGSVIIIFENDENLTSHLEIARKAQDDISYAKSRIDYLESDLRKIRSDADSYKNYITDMKKSLGDAAWSMKNLAGTIKKTASSIDDIVSDLESVLSDVKKLDSDLDTLMGRVEQQDVDNIKTLVDPVSTSFKPMFSDFSNIHLLFPTVLIMIIVFVSILLSNIITLNEMHSPAYMRNFVMPVRWFVFEAGLFATSAFISIFQISVLLAFAQHNLGIPVLPNITQLALIVVIIVSIFTLLGTVIAYFIRHQQASILVATFSGIALFIFSDALLPLKIMPKIASGIAAYNPIVISSELIRKLLFLGTDIFSQAKDLYAMAIFIIVIAAFLPLAKWVDKKRIV